MKIGELAEKTGIKASAIRFYEKQGLLSAGHRQPNGYRNYGDSAYRQLRLVLLAQNLGFSLEEIRRMSVLDENTKDEKIVEALEKRIIEVELMQEQLKVQKADLSTLIKKVKSGSISMTCQDIPTTFAFTN